MNNTLHIYPKELTYSDGWFTRMCVLDRQEKNGTSEKRELWYRFPEDIEPPRYDDCEPYLLAVLLDAMAERRRIVVHGLASRQLLSNLYELQHVWHRWAPRFYFPVEIETGIKDDSTPVEGAICAFSGGVDATFSLWRHATSKCSYRSQKINLCAIVHGFDIPLGKVADFECARKRAEQTVREVGVNLVPIVTNYKQVTRSRWHDAFGIALVAALNNFKNHAGTCLVGSAGPYECFEMPWGSSPVTDHLLSGNGFNVIHDGASHSRSEKIREIADWPTGVANLRVCWEGTSLDKNCGKCEKCIRTKMNFLVCGKEIPSSFPEADLMQQLKSIKLTNNAVRDEWKSIYDIAIKENVEKAWVAKIRSVYRSRLRKKRPKNLILKAKNGIKSIVKQLLLTESRRRDEPKENKSILT